MAAIDFSHFSLSPASPNPIKPNGAQLMGMATTQAASSRLITPYSSRNPDEIHTHSRLGKRCSYGIPLRLAVHVIEDVRHADDIEIEYFLLT